MMVICFLKFSDYNFKWMGILLATLDTPVKWIMRIFGVRDVVVFLVRIGLIHFRV